MIYLAAILFFFRLISAVDLTVDLNYLKIQGINPGNGVSQWLGIPYASAPLGQYRWKAPVDYPKDYQLYRANAHQPTCISNTATYDPNSTSSSENCLFLDVYAPSGATTSSKLPVYVFIQGGGFNYNSHPNYNGNSLIKASGGKIIIITFNYRVGVYGFLASKEVKAAGNANAGLLDQRKCLQWVQRYISLFGGDPAHVTIGGPSAGGASVILHLTAYGGRNDGLFHAAAAESQAFPNQLTISEAQYQYDNFVNRVGCSGKTDTLQCMRSMSTERLQVNQGNIPYPGQSNNPLYMWSAVIDGDFIVDYTYRMFAEGRFVKVPTIAGAVTNDGTNFAPRETYSAGGMNAFLLSNFPALTTSMLGTIDATYSPGPNYPGAGSYWPPAAQAYGEMRYRCPGLFVSDSQSRYRVNAWNYHYNVLAPDSISSGNGVTHTVETNAIWGPTNGSPSNYYADSPFVQAMQGYWISFIRSYDPNTFRYPGTIKWEQWQPWLRQSVVINNNGTAMEPCSSNLKSRCSYLQRIGVTIQQ